MELTILSEIGLSDGEIKIYSTLLRSGPLPISKIHEKVRIERRNIYDILNKLIERGLVSYIKENKRKVFRISHPTRILEYLEEKREDIERKKQQIKTELPTLVEAFDKKQPSIDAEIFRGSEGVKTVWNSMLESKEIYWLGAGDYIPFMLPIFFRNWTAKRAKKGIPMKMLYRGDAKRPKKEVLPLETKKFLPPDFNSNPVVTAIFGNSIVNFIYKEDFFTIVIQSKDLADHYRMYFKYLWKNVAK